MLQWFNLCSGLNVNFHKSSLVGVNVDEIYAEGISNVNFHKSSLVGVNVDEIYAEGISGVLRCKCDTLPIKHLGLPLGANPNRISTWKPVLSQIRGWLNSWKGQLLSMAERAILIKSVIFTIRLYYMSIFCIPKTVARKITTMQSRFL
jgi:hypothetical protein